MIIKTEYKAQTAVEYMLLLGVVAAIVIVGLRLYLGRTQFGAHVFFNRAGTGIAGKPNLCGDGVCGPYENADKCCIDCPPGGSSCSP